MEELMELAKALACGIMRYIDHSGIFIEVSGRVAREVHSQHPFYPSWFAKGNYLYASFGCFRTVTENFAVLKSFLYPKQLHSIRSALLDDV